MPSLTANTSSQKVSVDRATRHREMIIDLESKIAKAKAESAEAKRRFWEEQEKITHLSFRWSPSWTSLRRKSRRLRSAALRGARTEEGVGELASFCWRR